MQVQKYNFTNAIFPAFRRISIWPHDLFGLDRLWIIAIKYLLIKLAWYYVIRVMNDPIMVRSIFLS